MTVRPSLLAALAPAALLAGCLTPPLGGLRSPHPPPAEAITTGASASAAAAWGGRLNVDAEQMVAAEAAIWLEQLQGPWLSYRTRVSFATAALDRGSEWEVMAYAPGLAFEVALHNRAGTAALLFGASIQVVINRTDDHPAPQPVILSYLTLVGGAFSVGPPDGVHAVFNLRAMPHFSHMSGLIGQAAAGLVLPLGRVRLRPEAAATCLVELFWIAPRGWSLFSEPAVLWACTLGGGLAVEF